MVARLVQDNRWGWYGPAVSKDGRYIADRHAVARLGGLQVRLHDLATGEVRLLVAVNPGERRFDYPIVSPDGRHVAYGSTPQPNGSTPEPKGQSEVYVVETDGSSPRLLFNGGRPLAWSPDGRHILAVIQRGDKGPERVLLPVRGGDPVPIGTGRMSDARFSPDGNQIADCETSQAWGQQDRYIPSAAQGGPEIPLVENYGAATAPVYWPDGKRLLFLSDHAGSQDLWSIPLMNGARGGPPVLVKQQVHKLLGVTDAGECYFQTAFLRSTLYTAVFDGQSGKMTARPRAMTDRDFNLGGAWSPDGEYFAYTAEVGALPYVQLEVVIRSTKSGEERRLTRKQFPDKDVAEQTPQWFPDSRSLLLQTWTGTLYRFDVRTSDLRPLLGGVSLHSAKLAPDGHTIYHAARDVKTQETRILKRDLEGGVETEICRFKQNIVGSFSVSPDGSRLVFSVADAATGNQPGSAIMTVATSGGTPKELYKTSKRPNIFDPTWIADGRWVLFSRQYDDVYSIRAEGGEPTVPRRRTDELSLRQQRASGRQAVRDDRRRRRPPTLGAEEPVRTDEGDAVRFARGARQAWMEAAPALLCGNAGTEAGSKHSCRFPCLAKDSMRFCLIRGPLFGRFSSECRLAEDHPFRPGRIHHITRPRAWRAEPGYRDSSTASIPTASVSTPRRAAAALSGSRTDWRR